MKIFKIAGRKVAPGENVSIDLTVAKLYDSTDLTMPLKVIRGKEEGPIVFLAAAIHGDEINGVEIIREVISILEKRKINGTVIAAPIVNVFGFNHRSRYLPDRRDLNRSFPGNKNGSLAARVAKIFFEEVVKKCTHGIDFHTGAIHRSNYPQIRADLDCEETRAFAKSFGCNFVINSKTRDGSLREAARKRGVKTLLFEGGQALRFEEDVIEKGVEGCLNALKHVGLLKTHKRTKIPKQKVFNSSFWVRAPRGGTFRLDVSAGERVKKGQILGVIKDPLGEEEEHVECYQNGYVLGVNELPLITMGEALVHIACKGYVATQTDALLDVVNEA